MSSDQMGFDLCGPERRRADRRDERFTGENLVIAIRPDATAAAAAQAIARDYRALYRIDRQPLTQRGLHVSLVGIDRAAAIGNSLIHVARTAIEGVSFEPFEISLDSVMSFRSGASRPIVLAASKPNPALRSVLLRLADRLDGLAVPFGIDPDFLVHMTLVYYDRPVMPEHLPAPISWKVDRLWLIRSLIGQGSHEFLWPRERQPDG